MLWQPTLNGTFVRLRPLTAEDWPALLAAASDPLVWELHPEPTRWQPDVFARYFEGALASQGALAVLDTDNGKIIGSSRFYGHRPDLRAIEIGYTFLERAYWGGTANRELKHLMLAHAFTHVDTAWFVVGESNHRSRRAMEKVGGQRVEARDVPLDEPGIGKVYYRITSTR